VEEEDRHERYAGDHVHRRVPKRLLPDPDHRRRHEPDHRRPQTVEDGAHPLDVAVGYVGVREAEDKEEGREHERDTREDAALHPVQQPTHVDRELLCLGSGQQHAVVQRVQEPPVADPPAALHELLVHDRDLARRPAEVDKPELDPEPRRDRERHPMG
jgi:hypothetical protein